MEQVKSWWPDEVKDALEAHFGAGSVSVMPSSFLTGKAVKLKVPDGIARSIDGAYAWYREECEKPLPHMEYDSEFDPERVLLTFSKDAKERGEQVHALCHICKRFDDEQNASLSVAIEDSCDVPDTVIARPALLHGFMQRPDDLLQETDEAYAQRKLHEQQTVCLHGEQGNFVSKEVWKRNNPFPDLGGIDGLL